MSDLLAAPSQMGMSLAFHIIFVVVGVALPLMMTIAEFLWHKTGDAAYLALAKRWAKVQPFCSLWGLSQARCSHSNWVFSCRSSWPSPAL
jgi:cytochrome bd-type quinol oxidase subunit 1